MSQSEDWTEIDVELPFIGPTTVIGPRCGRVSWSFERVSRERQLRYMNDPEFHARVFVVMNALWETVSTLDLGHRKPYPFDRLASVTKDDLAAYAIAAVEAIEALETPSVPSVVQKEQT